MRVGIPGPSKFAPLYNFRDLIFDDLFWEYLMNTVIFTVSTVFIGIVIQLGVALLLNQKTKLQRFFRSAILLPWAIPLVVSSFIWRLILNSQYGVLNDILLKLDLINQPIAWLGGKWTALGAIVVTDIWTQTPLAVIILLAGLQVIPEQLYEASNIDGASVWQRFKHVIMPLWRPQILVVLMIRTMFSFRMFAIIFVLTGGGPGGSTHVWATHIYNLSFLYFRMGKGAALSVIMIFITIIFVGFYLKGLQASAEKV